MRRTPSVEKTFTDISGAHASLKVGIRIWANDMWRAASGPVTVEVLDGSTVLGSYSLDRTTQLSCDSNWNTYYNTDGGKVSFLNLVNQHGAPLVGGRVLNMLPLLCLTVAALSQCGLKVR